MPSLSDAITAVEKSGSAYQASVTTTTNDQAAADAIKAKLDAANAQVATDQTAQATAATAFNASLDALIASATAAKIPPTVPTTPSQPATPGAV